MTIVLILQFISSKKDIHGLKLSFQYFWLLRRMLKNWIDDLWTYGKISSFKLMGFTGSIWEQHGFAYGYFVSNCILHNLIAYKNALSSQRGDDINKF